MDIMKNAKLREALSRPGILGLPGCHDAFTARIIQEVGFEVAYMGGNGTMASMLGKPDIGLGTATEMIDQAHRISECIDIPLICDADTGYGNLNNVWRTVRDYEAAGVSGIHIEDQNMPKKCGAMGKVNLIDADEMCDKIKIACKARKDPNFVIIARTDCHRTLGYNETVRRCKMFAEAGADLVFPTGVLDPEVLRKLTSTVTTIPFFMDICEWGPDRYVFSDKELEDLGIKVVIRPVTSILRAGKVFTELYSYYKENGTTRPFSDDGKLITRQEYQNLLGFEFESNIKDLIK